jgi:hypothetical protein
VRFINTALILFSSFSFIIYGILCLVSPKMKLEFVRFGVSQFRLLTGILELMGGLGLLVGFLFNSTFFILLSAGGLSVLMLMGFGVRIKIKDGLLKSSPAFIFMVINLIIFVNKI